MKKINLQNFFSDNPKIKYACAKQAIAVSQKNPEKLYPDFDFFLQFLRGENKILKWTAIRVIGSLSQIDGQKKVDKVIPEMINLLHDKNLITAANAIGALSEIAQNKQNYGEKILQALLKVEKAKYYHKGEISPECTNVAIGHVIPSLEKFGQEVYQRDDVKRFLKRQTKNTRLKVKHMAHQLLKNKNI